MASESSSEEFHFQKLAAVGNSKHRAVAEQKEDFDDEDDDDAVENDQGWDDWRAGGEEENDEECDPEILCLFCDSTFRSRDQIFQHCGGAHQFDFIELKKRLGLDFYACFKLLNYIRNQVAEGKLSDGSCIQRCKASHYNGGKFPWDDDKYLSPYMQDDALLYSFGEDEADEDYPEMIDRDELIKEIKEFKVSDVVVDEGSVKAVVAGENGVNRGKKDPTSTSNGHLGSLDESIVDRDSKVMLKQNAAGIRNANQDYFGGYSSFIIHKEMISDQVRTEAYREAILSNPSLFNGAVVMDVGCGTGILSLFAARAGASRVVAVEASEKMAAVATQVARENGLLWLKSEQNGKCCRGIQVVQGMVEEVDGLIELQPKSVDILISEWMGYCLLYETMLSSVLCARDRWLKPGGAVLPDTATMFVAGFGKGATSIPFWENVYGFNMSCIGNEVFEHASKNPIVDTVYGEDIVTRPVVLKAFDLATMTADQMDFTAIVELEPKSNETVWCYGLVVWFDTDFSSRFCKEKSTVLSTSPFTPKTHWSQTILTFQGPVAMSHNPPSHDSTEAASDLAAKLQSRISIARAAHQHRSIDMSLEITAISHDGRKHHRAIQLFTL